MAYILNIETSTTNCSVALSENGVVVGLKEDNSLEYSHAERLHVYIDEVLKIAKVSKDQLEAIAISKGPGSYTGLLLIYRRALQVLLPRYKLGLCRGACRFIYQ